MINKVEKITCGFTIIDKHVDRVINLLETPHRTYLTLIVSDPGHAAVTV